MENGIAFDISVLYQPITLHFQGEDIIRKDTIYIYHTVVENLISFVIMARLCVKADKTPKVAAHKHNLVT